MDIPRTVKDSKQRSNISKYQGVNGKPDQIVPDTLHADPRWKNLMQLSHLFVQRTKLSLPSQLILLDLHAELAGEASLPRLELLKCLSSRRHRLVMLALYLWLG